MVLEISTRALDTPYIYPAVDDHPALQVHMVDQIDNARRGAIALAQGGTLLRDGQGIPADKRASYAAETIELRRCVGRLLTYWSMRSFRVLCIL